MIIQWRRLAARDRALQRYCVERRRRQAALEVGRVPHGRVRADERVAAGAARGASIASLQASDMGRPVYERMGFEVLDHYHGFVSPGADTTNAFSS